MKLLEMTTIQKCIFCVQMVKLVKKQIVDEEASRYIEKAIDLSWKWMEKHLDISDELYDYLDNEEYGFTVFQESESNEIMIATWNCIIDSFAYICRKAYEEQGAIYFPEPVELVNDGTLIHLVDSYLICSGDNHKELDRLISEIK